MSSTPSMCGEPYTLRTFISTCREDTGCTLRREISAYRVDTVSFPSQPPRILIRNSARVYRPIAAPRLVTAWRDENNEIYFADAFSIVYDTIGFAVTSDSPIDLLRVVRTRGAPGSPVRDSPRRDAPRQLPLFTPRQAQRAKRRPRRYIRLNENNASKRASLCHRTDRGLVPVRVLVRAVPPDRVSGERFGVQARRFLARSDTRNTARHPRHDTIEASRGQICSTN